MDSTFAYRFHKVSVKVTSTCTHCANLYAHCCARYKITFKTASKEMLYPLDAYSLSLFLRYKKYKDKHNIVLFPLSLAKEQDTCVFKKKKKKEVLCQVV